MFVEPAYDGAHLFRLRLERDVMHAANATHRRRRSLLGKIEERELIAAADVKEDVRGSWIVAILYNSRQAHPKHFDIKANRRFQVGADERQVIDAASLNHCSFSPPIR